MKTKLYKKGGKYGRIIEKLLRRCCVCGGVLGFFFPFMKNLTTFRKEEKVPAMDFLAWVLIGFLLGGAMGAVFFTPA